MIFSSSSQSDIDAIQGNLSQDLDNLSNWFCDNELIFNLRWCCLVLVSQALSQEFSYKQHWMLQLQVPRRASGSGHLTMKCISTKFYKKPEGRVIPIKGASVPALLLLVPTEFTNRWLCQYLRTAAIIILHGQSPENAWSTPLGNEVSKSFTRNSVRRTVVFDF